jgi:drug/metabolite transporter (DMT)-like permease
MMFFLGLAAMPLADAAAIFFISPLIITAFSVVFLGEKVGPRRWLAVGIGMLGVIVVMRPGSSAFQLASLLPLAAAVGYAFLHILTRRIGRTESALAMTFYIQLTFIVVSGAIGLGFGDGRFAGTGDPSLEFLLREWVWPQSGDIWVLVLIGCASTFGGFLISQAYRLCEAGLAAPFEYIALPLAIFWGFVIFGEWPDIMTWVGVAMIIAGGLYMVWRETRVAQTIVAEEPTRR